MIWCVLCIIRDFLLKIINLKDHITYGVGFIIAKKMLIFKPKKNRYITDICCLSLETFTLFMHLYNKNVLKD